MSASTIEVVERFVEQMGLIAEADGLPRIAGRLLGVMIIEGGPLSFSSLASRLKVSRGSISTNTRLLVSLGMLERVAQTGDRQDYFQLVEAPYARLMQGVVQRMTKARKLVAATRTSLPEKMKSAHSRLGDLDEFYRAAIKNTQTLIDKFDR